eukprot:14540013-Alexandrium_andersonii.AAC.1
MGRLANQPCASCGGPALIACQQVCAATHTRYGNVALTMECVQERFPEPTVRVCVARACVRVSRCIVSHCAACLRRARLHSHAANRIVWKSDSLLATPPPVRVVQAPFLQVIYMLCILV